MWTASTTSALEATWTVIAVIGSAVALGFVAHVWLSYRAVHEWIARGLARRWGPRHTFVTGFLVGAGLLLVVWLGFVALGLNAAHNPPAPDPVRAASSERGGWVLVGIEVFLLAVTGLLGWAWLAVGRPAPPTVGEPATVSDLLALQTDAGRELFHAFADDMQIPVAALDAFALDDRLPGDVRSRAAEGLAYLDQAMARARALHAEIRRRGGVPS